VCENAINQRKETRNQWLSDQHNREKKMTHKEYQKVPVEYSEVKNENTLGTY